MQADFGAVSHVSATHDIGSQPKAVKPKSVIRKSMDLHGLNNNPKFNPKLLELLNSNQDDLLEDQSESQHVSAHSPQSNSNQLQQQQPQQQLQQILPIQPIKLTLQPPTAIKIPTTAQVTPTPQTPQTPALKAQIPSQQSANPPEPIFHHHFSNNTQNIVCLF